MKRTVHVIINRLPKLCNVRKSISKFTYIFLKLGKCADKHATTTHRKWLPTMKILLSTCYCKSEKEFGFLTLISSCGDTTMDFQLNPAKFLVREPPFYVSLANKLEFGIWLHIKVKKEYS